MMRIFLIIVCGLFIGLLPSYAQKITKVEYFIDADPGAGNAVPIALSEIDTLVSLVEQVDLTGIAPGFHSLSVRVQSDSLGWGATQTQPFRIEEGGGISTVQESAQPLTQAEYFIDKDPGVGNGIPIFLPESDTLINLTEVVDLTDVSPGFHSLSARVKTDAIGWGATFTQPFRVEESTGGGSTVTQIAQPLTQAEYFIDTDPGVGNGISILLPESDTLINLTEVIDLTDIAPGFHSLSARVKTDSIGWGATFTQPFRVEEGGGISTGPQIAQPLSQAEYFIDEDPGVGNGIPILLPESDTLINLTEVIDLTDIVPGFHSLSARVKTDSIGWGATFTQPFRVEEDGGIGTGPQIAQPLTQAEYFIDTDPGVGNGIPILLPESDTLINLTDMVDLTGVSPGFHSLSARVKTDSIGWGATFTQPFRVEESTGVSNPYLDLPTIVAAEYFIDSLNPDLGSAFPIDITDPDTAIQAAISLTVAELNLDAGKHKFFVRVLDSLGNWSVDYVEEFEICDPETPTVLCGELANRTVLSSACSPYTITCDAVLAAGDTLIIEEGTEVNFILGAKLNVYGYFETRGSVDNKVVFNGLQDSTSNGGLIFHSGSVVDINQTRFESIGAEEDDYALQVNAGSSVTIRNTDFLNNTKNVIAHANAFKNLSNLTLNYIDISGIDNAGIAILPQFNNTGAYRLNTNFTIPTEATLLLRAGSGLAFATLNQDNLTVRGNLEAQGNPDKPVRFFGIGEPKGDIFFESGSNGIIRNSTFTNMNTAITLRNNTRPLISGNAFDRNNLDISAYPTSLSLVEENVGVTVAIQNASSWGKKALLPKQGSGSVYSISSLRVFNSDTLEISPGAEISIQSWLDIYQDAILISDGTKALPINFKSTNRSGYIYIRGGTKQFTNTVFTDMGQGIYPVAGSVKVDTSRFIGNNYGIYALSNSRIEGNANTFLNNAYGIYTSSGNAEIRKSNFIGNTTLAIWNQGSDTVIARNNWWGDASGPFHPTLNPDGQGDQVSDRVDFGQWSETISPSLADTDLRLSSIDAPVPPYCALTNSEVLTVQIINEGLAIEDTIYLSYTLNGGEPIQETLIGANLAPGASLSYTFQSTLDLSQSRDYQLRASVNQPGDDFPENDALQITIENVPELVGTPINLLPENGKQDVLLPMDFSWSPVLGATTYELYVWPLGEGRPLNPVRTTDKIIVGNYNNLSFGTDYEWQVVAKNDCGVVESTVQGFRVRELPDLIVSSVTFPANVFSEQTIEVDWTVENQGIGGTLNEQWTDGVYLVKELQPFNTGRYLGGVNNPRSLAPGETYNQSTTVKIPQGVAGKYQIVIVSARFGNLTESNRNNNESIVTNVMEVILRPAPDLLVQNVVGQRNSFSGQDVQLRWSVSNDGAGETTTNYWVDRVYLSPEQEFNRSTARYLTQFSYRGFLKPEEGYQQLKTVTLPRGISGTYYFFVEADANNRVFEVFTENNIGRSDSINVILTPPPDLTVTEVNVIDTASNGERITVNWTVENIGAVAVEGKRWNDNIYITGTDDSNLSNGVSIGTVTNTQTVALDGSYTKSIEVTIPNDYVGDYQIYVSTDNSDRIFETNGEDNNKLGSPIHILNPDIAPIVEVIPNSALAGSAMTVRASIVNRGPGRIFNMDIQERFYISTGAEFIEEEALLLREFPQTISLSVADTLRQQRNLIIPDGISGNYYVYLISDATDAVQETNEENNISRSAGTVNISLPPYPDLLVTDIQVPDSVDAGEPIDISFMVNNLGDGAASNSVWTDKVYVSVQPDWDPEEAHLIKTIPRSKALESRGSYDIDTEVTIPMLSMMVLGLDSTANCYLFIETDTEDDVYEFDGEDNNRMRSVAFFVSCPPPVDLVMTDVRLDRSEAVPGAPLWIEWKVENQGSRTTFWDYELWYDGVFFSRDTVWSEDDLFVTDAVWRGPLLNGQGYTLDLTFDIPFGLSGDYYLLMVADHRNLTKDKVLENNYLLISDVGGVDQGGPVSVNVNPISYPDLTANTFTAPFRAIAGQPLRVDWSVTNNGDTATTVGGWTDAIYFNDAFTTEGIAPIGTKVRNIDLAQGASYSDSLEVTIPIDAEGNRLLLFRTDSRNSVFEEGRESDNLLFAQLQVERPAPSDVIVRDVFTDLDSVRAGESLLVTWTVRNQGINPAVGKSFENVYLSRDTLLDASDLLVGQLEVRLSLVPGSEEVHELQVTLNRVDLGDYHVLVAADARNNIIESDEGNNAARYEGTVNVGLGELIVGQTTADVLMDGQFRYYRLEISDENDAKTLAITLNSDALEGANEIFLSYGQVPTRASADYIFTEPFSTVQEIIVPDLRAGEYFLLVTGEARNAEVQQIDITPSIVPFSVRSVDANKGGNTGIVTVRLKGALFEEGMVARLQSDSLGTVEAYRLELTNSTLAYASFDLSVTSLGIYDVQIEKPNGALAILENAFEVVPESINGLTLSYSEGDGSGGGSSSGSSYKGFVCCERNLGLDNLIEVGANLPLNTRINRVVSMTFYLKNTGNVDVPVPIRYLISLFGAPLSEDIEGLEKFDQGVFMEFREPDGPKHVLRPGAESAITVYTKATNRLRFQLVE